MSFLTAQQSIYILNLGHSLSIQRRYHLKFCPSGRFSCDWLSVPPLSGAVWHLPCIFSLYPQKQLIPWSKFEFFHLVQRDGPYTCRCDLRERNWRHTVDDMGTWAAYLFLELSPRALWSCSSSIPDVHFHFTIDYWCTCPIWWLNRSNDRTSAHDW